VLTGFYYSLTGENVDWLSDPILIRNLKGSRPASPLAIDGILDTISYSYPIASAILLKASLGCDRYYRWWHRVQELGFPLS
jgi:hypothetical protein